MRRGGPSGDSPAWRGATCAFLLFRIELGVSERRSASSLEPAFHSNITRFSALSSTHFSTPPSAQQDSMTGHVHS